MSEGPGRYFSWLALGAPVALTAWFFARRKRTWNPRAQRQLPSPFSSGTSPGVQPLAATSS